MRRGISAQVIPSSTSSGESLRRESRLQPSASTKISCTIVVEAAISGNAAQHTRAHIVHSRMHACRAALSEAVGVAVASSAVMHRSSASAAPPASAAAESNEVSRAQPCQPLRLPCLRTRVLHADINAHTKSHTHAHISHTRAHISHTSESAAAFVGFCGSGRALRARRCSRRRGRAGKPKEIEN